MTTQTLVSQFRQHGYCGPVPVLTPKATQGFLAAFCRYLEENRSRVDEFYWGGRLIFSETHLFIPWVARLAATPAILDVVEGLLGPDLLVWSSQWFPKLAGQRAAVDWHRDAAWSAIRPPDVVTAWISLTDSTSANGCLRVIPNSHNARYDVDLADPLYEEPVEVDERQAVELALRAGEMSLHHAGIVHDSRPNLTAADRIGLAVRYTRPGVTTMGSERELAVLVRGRDLFGHFELVHHTLDRASPELQAESLRRKRVNLRLPEDR